MFDDIKAFHEKFELTYKGPPRELPTDLAEFRLEFIVEEAKEYFDAYDNGDLVGMLDALVDLTYVTLGTAYLHGFDFPEAWRRVHEANMLKVRAENEADSKRGSTHDVVKPKDWRPPLLDDLAIPHRGYPEAD